MSAPASNTRPASGRTSPPIKLNNVVFPAPFGPRMPRVAPPATSKLTSSMTFSAPKLLDTPCSERSADMRVPASANAGACASCTHGLQRPGHWDSRRGFVVHDHQVIFELFAFDPLAADERRFRDVLYRTFTPGDRSDDGI